MDDAELDGTIAFLALAERLKDTLRNSRTSTGRTESTAEHTWRMCLMAMLFGEELGVDPWRLVQVCLVHDLAEALTGDLPAPAPRQAGVKEAREREAMATLTMTLPARHRQKLLALWEEYEARATPEGRVARGLDKLETILQHAQGVNPPGFDLGWNLGYGRGDTAAPPLLAALRDRLDAATRARLSDEAEAVRLPGTP